MSFHDLGTELQELLPRLAAKAPHGWRLIFLNYEFVDHEQGAVSDCVAIAVTKPWIGAAKKQQIETGANEWHVLNKVCRSLSSKAGQSFLTLDLILEKGGRFKTFVDYERPLRINGDLKASNRHIKYASEYPLLG